MPRRHGRLPTLSLGSAQPFPFFDFVYQAADFTLSPLLILPQCVRTCLLLVEHHGPHKGNLFRRPLGKLFFLGVALLLGKLFSLGVTLLVGKLFSNVAALLLGGALLLARPFFRNLFAKSAESWSVRKEKREN